MTRKRSFIQKSKTDADFRRQEVGIERGFIGFFRIAARHGVTRYALRVTHHNSTVFLYRGLRKTFTLFPFKASRDFSMRWLGFHT